MVTQCKNNINRDVILGNLQKMQGKVGFYYKNLDTEEELGYNENEAFKAASIIKLPIFAVISKIIEEGKYKWSEQIQVKNSDKVPPCGALYFFTNEPMVDIRTLCSLMITISDNAATNLLIEHFGIDELNRGFLDIGLNKTKINRLLFDEKASMEGKQNFFVPKEICQLLEKIHKKSFVNEKVSTEVEKTLLHQQINHKIPGYLRDEIQVAHKTGEDDGITHDVGIVYAREPFVIAFASNEADVPVFERFIREISLELSGLVVKE